jgi:hypothetical protein
MPITPNDNVGLYDVLMDSLKIGNTVLPGSEAQTVILDTGCVLICLVGYPA